MAQLVKLLDYVSRYEQDLSHYPTHYIRLKKYQWERLKTQWENGVDLTEQRHEVQEESTEGKKFSSLLRLFGKREVQTEISNDINTDDENDLDLNLIYNPSSIDQLRQHYVDQLFHFQMKWASSTLMDKSNVDPKFYRDSLLRQFAQQLPDNYLLFYYPVVKVKNAPVELDIIIVTPVECMCIKVLEQEDVAAFIGSSDRFWLKKIGSNETKIVNPLLALNRMEKIVSSILRVQNIEFPVRKYLLSRNGYIDYPGTLYDVNIVDRRSFEGWFSALQQLAVPMKFNQFKTAQAILDAGQTTASSRLFEVEQEEITE